MYLCIIFVLLVIPAAAYNGTVQPWSCPLSHVECPATLSDLDRVDECQTTDECQTGAQCCYRGCVRKCEFPHPCEQVICKDGYLCEAREKPCDKKPCQPEATCLPETQVRCVAPTCDAEECKPGYERAKDKTGCELCDCVRKRECGTNCQTFCAYGFEEGPDGCPVCMCKPEPPNMCSNVTCGPKEECRFVQVTCIQAPCPPIAMCVPVVLARYENSCSLTDPTTVGLPVLEYKKRYRELDCAYRSCPDNTVCTSLGSEIKRCCWQSTQEHVLPPPKAGECPTMGNSSEPKLECQFDGACPRGQKCCHRQTDRERSRASGYCTTPIQVKETRPEMCPNVSIFVRVALTWFGFC
ncbi:hypothetical protein BsWGS_12908 [Bradybaena similaris]